MDNLRRKEKESKSSEVKHLVDLLFLLVPCQFGLGLCSIQTANPKECLSGLGLD